MAERIAVIVIFFLIELVVVLVGEFVLVLAPDRCHAVESFFLNGGFVLGRNIINARALFEVVVFHIHFNRIVDIVGVFLDEGLYLPLHEELAVFFIVGIIFEEDPYLCADLVLFGFFNSIAVNALGLPKVSLIRAECLCEHLNLLCYHKCGIEAYAKLTDDVNVLGGVVLIALETERAAVCDSTEVAVEFFLCHTDTVIGNGDDLVVLVNIDLDEEIGTVHSDAAVGEGFKIELVHCVARI